MAKKRILILGAGLAGLSVAWHLQKKGIDCQVFEKEAEVGGLCRSKNIKGFTFDYDGHLLYFKHRYTFNLVKNLLGNNLTRHQRSAWVYAFGRYGRYPFQANLYGLPKSVVQDCLLGFISAYNNGSKKTDNHCSFYEWIMHTLGAGMARHFMLPYNTKFWTLSPKELTCDWLAGFIPIPSLRQVIEGTIEESKRKFGYNAEFWYPKKGGIKHLSLALASQIKNIYTNCQVTEINLYKKEIKIASGNKERYDYLVSTLPLPELPNLVKRMPKHIYNIFKKLKWNSIFNLNLGIDGRDSSKKHWAYFPGRETSFFRVGFPNNFSSSVVPENKRSLYVEVSHSEYKPIDKSSIVLRIEKNLKNVGILSQHDKVVVRDINDIKYGYPIYNNNYNPAREKIFAFLNKNSIIACGRYGSWRYMSMEDVILDGAKIAEKFSGSFLQSK